MKLSSLSLLVLFVLSIMAEGGIAAAGDDNGGAVHIVYTERAQGEEEPEAFHVRTLASVLGRSISNLGFSFTPKRYPFYSCFRVLI